MRYIQRFDSASTEQAAIDAGQLGKPYIAFIEDGQYIDWNTKDRGEDYYKNLPSTFEVLSGGVIELVAYMNDYSLLYSKDGGNTWTEHLAGFNRTTIPVNAGESIIFKRDGLCGHLYQTSHGSTTCSIGHRFTSGTTAVFNISGNLLSMRYGDNFRNVTVLEEPVFYWMFNGCTGVNDVSHVSLPATTLFRNCYDSLFRGSRTVRAPKLPATEGLPGQGYMAMFADCPNLVEAPELPALSMERGNNCYTGMFENCPSLTYIKCLLEDGSVYGQHPFWVSGVSPTGTFVKHPNATWPTGNDGIPAGWTVIDADI